MIHLPDIFNYQTITADGELVFARIYTAMYPKKEFVEDARPDYYILRTQFDQILKEVYGTIGDVLYRSYLSGKCLECRIIPQYETMFFVTFIIAEDVVDRNYRLSPKDLEFVDELGDINSLQEHLDNTSAKDYNDRILAPIIFDDEMTQAIVRVFYYPVLQSDKGILFCEKYNAIKFNRDFNRSSLDSAIYTLGEGRDGLVLNKHFLDTSKYKGDIISSNYNDNFKEAYDKIISFLKSDQNGLTLLTGEPGTGKSSFLMHLTSICTDLDVRFVFIPAVYANALSQPDFLQFAVSSLNKSVLILEDAEEVLKDRAAGGSGAVSNILNITDGILGKLVKVKIIATVNKSHIIDTAMVRKGRLRLKYEFEKLAIDKANLLLTKLGKDTTTTKPMTLAEIYNNESNVVDPCVQTKRTIGF